MDQANQANLANGLDVTPDIPLKRKRGRPRKDQSGNRSGSALVPPGFKAVNEKPRNLHSQMNRIDDENDVMVGQAVTGVIEVAFDAGYLLTVRIGNSNTFLRGVVFKPGHYVPISAENDIAPRAEMIRRRHSSHPFPMENNQTRVRGHKQHRSREKNEQNETALALTGSPPATHAHRGSKGKHLSPVAAAGTAPPVVPPVGTRGTVVPVILQPLSLANGTSPTHIVVSSKGKQAQTVAGGAGEQAAKPMKFDERGQQFSSQSTESHMGNRAAAVACEDSDRNEPLSIEPLRAIHSIAHNPTPKVMEKSRAGRMTELLLAVQENMANMQEARVDNIKSEIRIETHKMNYPEAADRR